MQIENYYQLRLRISIELLVENCAYNMFNDYYSKLKWDTIVA